MTIKLLNDRYQVIRTLGSGGFGETFLAEDTYMPSKRRCVVKQLRPINHNPQIYQLVQERFQREAAILEELGGASDQIPTLYAYFQLNGQFYLVQEWIEGDTLSAKLQKQGIFSESAVQELLVNLLPVIEYVHSQRIIHRDIKPDNIILRHHDGKPVLIDFGAVRESMGTVVNSQGNPTSSIVIGTPGYMPSEQAAGRPVYSSDLYSLGITAIYLLSGKQPQKLETDSHTGEILWQHDASNISPTLTGVIDQAIAYHPRDRYPTARAMLDALQSIANTITVTQPPANLPATSPETVPATPTPTPQSGGQKNIIIASAIAGGLIGASVIIGFVLTKSPQPVGQQTASSTFSPAANVPNVTPTKGNSTTPPVVTSPSTAEVITQKPPQPVVKLPTPQFSVHTTDDDSWLSSRPVKDADLNGKDGFQLDIMRNSIYARHGRRFDNPGLQDYFNRQPWYRPIYAPKDFPANLLSKLEQQNVENISKYQDRYNLRHFQK